MSNEQVESLLRHMSSHVNMINVLNTFMDTAVLKEETKEQLKTQIIMLNYHYLQLSDTLDTFYERKESKKSKKTSKANHKSYRKSRGAEKRVQNSLQSTKGGVQEANSQK